MINEAVFILPLETKIFIRTIALAYYKPAAVVEIVHKLVEPPADSFVLLPALKFVVLVPVLLVLVERLERYLRREQLTDRKLD